MRGPRLPAGATFVGKVRLQDLVPTILELQGHEVYRGLDGISRAPELTGAEQPRLLPVIGESPRVRPRPEFRHAGLNRGALRSVQQGGCKLVWNLDREESALYDLEADALGLDLTPGSERCAEAPLRQLFETWMMVHPDALEQSRGSRLQELPPDLRRDLEALGYLVD
jgi:arylsulfatase A-like enzyme